MTAQTFDGINYYYYPYVFTSSTTDGTWNTATGFPVQLSTTSGVNGFNIIPLTSGKVAVVFGRYSTTMSVASWSGSGWQTTVNTVSSLANYWKFSSVGIGDTVRIVFQ